MKKTKKPMRMEWYEKTTEFNSVDDIIEHVASMFLITRNLKVRRYDRGYLVGTYRGEHYKGEIPAYWKKIIKLELYLATDRRCAYCGRTFMLADIEIDHKIPKSHEFWGVDNRISNLTVTCKQCNIAKGAKDVIEFLEYLSPFLLGKCSRRELAKYKLYKKLKAKFKE